MKIYLDVSCLNRPFDDQSQTRIRLESEAVVLILDMMDKGEWQQVASDVSVRETDAMRDAERRGMVQALLQDADVFVTLTTVVFDRATELDSLGFKAADALHVAAAEAAQADVFLTCDDRLCRAARRHRQRLHVRVANPLDWLEEMPDGGNP